MWMVINPALAGFIVCSAVQSCVMMSLPCSTSKHGDEFPEYQNSVQYVQATQDFVNNPPDGTLTKTRPNGDTLYYDPATNTFASKTKDGAPKTMFKPAAGMDYWNRQ